MNRSDCLVRRPASWLSLFVAMGCTTILDIDGRYVSMSGAGGAPPSGSADASAGGADSGRLESGGVTSGSAGLVASGGTESGGAPAGAGGFVPSLGGAFASGGAPDSSGGAAGEPATDCTTTGCAQGQKCCGSDAVRGNSCYVPAPLVGCGDTGCDYCSDPVPTNSTPACKAGRCSFVCDPGFVESSGTCVPMGSGGSTGSGGATGSGGKTGTGGHTTGAGGTTSSGCEVDSECTKNCGPAGPFPCCMPNAMCGCTFFNLKLSNAPAIGYCLPIPPGF